MFNTAKNAAGVLAIGWPIGEYFLDWYRKPGPMLPWDTFLDLTDKLWLWTLVVGALWLGLTAVAKALRGLNRP